MVEKEQTLTADKILNKVDCKLCDVCFFPEEYCEISHVVLLKKKILLLKSGAKERLNENKESNSNDKANVEKNPNDIYNENHNINVNSNTNNSTNTNTNQPEITEKTGETIEGDKVEKKEKKSKKENKVLLEESKRGKKKHTTYVFHLDSFGFNLKDISKLLSKKFACSATVTKENGQDCITLTGEFADEIKYFICEKFPNQITEDKFKISRSN